MQIRSLLMASVLAFAGCEAVNQGDADGPDFTLGEACLPPDSQPASWDPAGSAKTSALEDTSGLKVLFVSADSLHFIVPVTLNCGLKYAFTANLPDPDTLVIAERVIGGTTAKCVCGKELTVRLKAQAGQSLDKVKVVKTPSGIFPDFQPLPGPRLCLAPESLATQVGVGRGFVYSRKSLIDERLAVGVRTVTLLSFTQETFRIHVRDSGWSAMVSPDTIRKDASETFTLPILNFDGLAQLAESLAGDDWMKGYLVAGCMGITDTAFTWPSGSGRDSLMARVDESGFRLEMRHSDIRYSEAVSLEYDLLRGMTRFRSSSSGVGPTGMTESMDSR